VKGGLRQARECNAFPERVADLALDRKGTLVQTVRLRGIAPVANDVARQMQRDGFLQSVADTLGNLPRLRKSRSRSPNSAAARVGSSWLAPASTTRRTVARRRAERPPRLRSLHEWTARRGFRDS
jgi:hypothetical protein